MYMERRETAANSNEDLGHVATASELRSAPCPTGGPVACADRPRWCSPAAGRGGVDGVEAPLRGGHGALQRSPATGRPSRPACGVREAAARSRGPGGVEVRQRAREGDGLHAVRVRLKERVVLALGGGQVLVGRVRLRRPLDVEIGHLGTARLQVRARARARA